MYQYVCDCGKRGPYAHRKRAALLMWIAHSNYKHFKRGRERRHIVAALEGRLWT